MNNVATTAAGITTYAAVQGFSPDMVISAGTAGGFKEKGASIGDVYLSTKCVFHSRRIPEGDQGDLEEYGFGHYRSPVLDGLATEAGLKQGVVSTSDSLDCTEIDLTLMRSEGVSVKEMEAAACAWICQQLKVPFIALKSVTDIVDGGKVTQDEFYGNLHMASEALQEKLTKVVSLLGVKPVIEWTRRASFAGKSSKPKTQSQGLEANGPERHPPTTAAVGTQGGIQFGGVACAVVLVFAAFALGRKSKR